MDILTYVIGFLFGVTFSVVSAFGFLLFRKKKIIKSIKEQNSNIAKQNNTNRDDVALKLKKVKEISERQHEFLSQINNPSKNALHSRYKNTIVSKIKVLEDEKYKILTEILKSGYDPVITMQNPHTNEIKETKLSDFMNEQFPKPPTDIRSKTKRGKLTLCESEEDFDKNNGNGKTIH